MHKGFALVAMATLLGCAPADGAAAGSSSGGGGSDDVVLPAPIVLRDLDAEEGVTCALGGKGRAQCWGDVEEMWDNVEGVAADVPPVHYGGGGADLVPGTPNTELDALDSGAGTRCISGNNEIRCTGANGGKKLGPTLPDMVDSWILIQQGQAVSVSNNRICGITYGRPFCRGQDGHYVVKMDDVPDSADISSGHFGDCALTTGGAVWCWINDYPAPVSLPATALSVAAGGAHACAIVAGGDVYCWGAGTDGQLSGSNGNSDAPRAVGLPAPATLIAAGRTHSCAYTAAGHVWCWGDGDPVPHALDLDL